jgi:anion-transporting  ArsA/GET3 family ATPase
VYQHLSTAVAGSQEYTAVAKLYELAVADEYDVIVLDTPPSRNAIEFLRAPDRLIGFLDAGTAGAFARAAGLVVSLLARIAGTVLLEDLRSFFALMSDLLGGFRARAATVHRLLRDPATGFILVSSPEREAVNEAISFGHELDRLGMHRCAVIANRVHPLDPADAGPDATTARLAPSLGPRLAAAVARTHEQVQVLARRDTHALVRLGEGLGMQPVCAADREADVHDAACLAELHDELFGFGKVRKTTGAYPT